MKLIYKTDSVEKTIRLGEKLGSLMTNETVLLIGEMGMGKTHLTRGIIKGLGIKDDVCSPTYMLVNNYEDGKKSAYHFDLYRLMDPGELFEMGFEDYIAEDLPVVIEWPDMVMDFPFKNKVLIEIKQDKEVNSRIIYVEADTGLLKAMERGDGYR